MVVGRASQYRQLGRSHFRRGGNMEDFVNREAIRELPTEELRRALKEDSMPYAQYEAMQGELEMREAHLAEQILDIEEPRLVMDYGMAKFLMFCFFIAGLFVGFAVVSVMLWLSQ